MKLREIAELAKGELCKGDPDLEITGVAAVGESTQQDISFYTNPRYLQGLRNSKAGAVFVPKDFSDDVPCATIKVEKPSVAFALLSAHFAPPPIIFPKAIHPTAIISEGVELGEDVSIQAYAVLEAGAKIGARTQIGAHAYVGHEARIGDDSILYTRVTVRDRCLIGNRVILHPGVVIGADGFGYEPIDGKHVKILQMGIVQIDDDVEIGANTTIDRARFGKTWIKEGTKIDNLVMIGHNCIIGPHAILCGQVGVSGSSKIGAYTTLAGQVGIAGHVEVGDHSILFAQSGLTKSMPPKEMWMGAPAEPVTDFRKKIGRIGRLGKLNERVKALEEKQQPES